MSTAGRVITKEELRRQIAAVLVKASGRGTGPALTEEEALAAFDTMCEHPHCKFWRQIRAGTGVAQMRKLIAIYKQIPGGGTITI